MSLDYVINTAPKLSLSNIDTGETIEAMFNPSEVELSITTNYEDAPVPGAGYQPSQFSYTQNPEIPLNLYYRVYAPEDQAERDTAEKFLLAHCYPRRGAGRILHQRPPRLLISWPNWIALQCTLRTFNLKVLRFNSQGAPIIEQFTLRLREVRDGQIFSEDVRTQGLLRSSVRTLGG